MIAIGDTSWIVELADVYAFMGERLPPLLQGCNARSSGQTHRGPRGGGAGSSSTG